MRKVLPYLGASLSILAVTWASAAIAQDNKAFTDVPPQHWAYEAVTSLQQKGIVVGYPGGYFRGKRTLTRYEFAVALDRALKTLPAPGTGPAGKDGAQGEPGPAGPMGPPGMTPEEVNQLKALAQEFRNELSQIGANVKDIQSRLDALSRDVADIKDRLNKMIQFNGEFFGGFQSTRSRHSFIDYGGAIRGQNNSLFENVDAVHDFHLLANANLPGGVKAKVDLVSSNYLGSRADSATGSFLGGNGQVNGNGTAQQNTLYEANLMIPIGGFGSGTTLTVGRYKNQITPLTYYRPDTDPYFNLPWYDDGNYVEDGFKLESKFGSARTTLFAGSYTSLTGSSAGNLINQPLVGANFGPRTFASTLPFGLSYAYLPNAQSVLGNFNDDRGQVLAQQSAGIHIGVPLAKIGELGVTAIDFGGNNGPQTGTFFNNVVVYGVNLKLKSFGRFNISGEAAKSVTQLGISNGDPSNSNDDNNAYTANVSYNSGPVQSTLGYQYIDPRFGAPGYWNKIGNWYNPTNIKGPFLRVNYNFSKALVGYIGGDYYTGARNRVFALGGSTTGFDINSAIYRGTTGIKYNINKYINVGADYEGVFWDLSTAVSGTRAHAHPLQQFITAKLGLNLASNTVLNMAYQMINMQDLNGATDGGATSNASVFTTQLAVKF